MVASSGPSSGRHAIAPSPSTLHVPDPRRLVSRAVMTTADRNANGELSWTEARPSSFSLTELHG